MNTGRKAIALAVFDPLTHKPVRIQPCIPLSRQAMNAFLDTG